QQNN
ncbi:response regulator, partial [Escherichia coli 95.0183]